VGVERACSTRNSADWLIDLGSMEQALFICSYFAHLKRAINRAFRYSARTNSSPKNSRINDNEEEANAHIR
jgi:hypothetical protein